MIFNRENNQHSHISNDSRVFHSLYKGFNNSKIKKVTSSGAQPDATDYYWFRSPVPNQIS